VSTDNTVRKSQLIIIIMNPLSLRRNLPPDEAAEVSQTLSLTLSVSLSNRSKGWRRPVLRASERRRAGQPGGLHAQAFVISSNLHRRHLPESQRAMIAARISQLPHGRAERNKEANLPLTPRWIRLSCSADSPGRSWSGDQRSCPRRDRPKTGGDTPENG
jgi:hypothetical protein